jgi:Domain of unknown function (DUF4203)
MLPASLQIPAAAVLLAGGLVACFAGYRLFRVVLSIYGFVLGALVATSIAGAGSTGALLVWGLVGGLIGAVILNLAYFLGVVLVGASIGAMLATMIWGRSGAEPQVLVVVLFAIAGAVAATILQRYVIIAGTAFGGAWTAIVGALALLGDRVAGKAASANDVWVVYPLDPAPGRRWVPIVWLALGLAGLVVQLRGGKPVARGKGKKK